MKTKTIVEIEYPKPFTGKLPDNLPEGVTLEVDEDSCVVGVECAGARIVASGLGKPPEYGGAPIGFGLREDPETGYDVGVWNSAWLVDDRWVMCEDCACAYEDGDLRYVDGEWVWKDAK